MPMGLGKTRKAVQHIVTNKGKLAMTLSFEAKKIQLQPSNFIHRAIEIREVESYGYFIAHPNELLHDKGNVLPSFRPKSSFGPTDRQRNHLMLVSD